MSAIGGRGTIRTATRPALALTAVCTALAALLWQPPTAYAQTASQWQLADLRASLAWRLSTGDGVTVAVLDSVVRMAQGFPDSPAAQLKLCDGLDGLLGVVRDRLAVQERALRQRKTDAERIDLLARFFAALHAHRPDA